MNARQSLAALAFLALFASHRIAFALNTCPSTSTAQDGSQVCQQSSDPFVDAAPYVLIDYWGWYPNGSFYDPLNHSAAMVDTISAMPATRWVSVADQYAGYAGGGAYESINMDSLTMASYSIYDNTNPVPTNATRAQVQAEAEWVMGQANWGANVIILIAFPATAPNFPTLNNTACAYHGSQTSGTTPWPWFIALPYIPTNVGSFICSGCQTDLSNCVMTTSIDHELEETVTDLTVNSPSEYAYLDNSGNEIGDKCSESSIGPGWATYAQRIGLVNPNAAFSDVWFQPMWSNAAWNASGNCVNELRTHGFGFYKNTSGQIQELASASQIVTFPNVDSSTAASPIAASSVPNGGVQAVYVDSSGNYIQNYGNGGYTNWSKPSGFTWITSYKPDVVSWGASELDFFGVAQSSVYNLFHRGYNSTNDTGWQNWGTMPGYLITSGVGVASWGYGRLDAFVAGWNSSTGQTHLLQAFCTSVANCQSGTIGWTDWGVLPNGIQGGPDAAGYTSGWAQSSSNSNPVNRLDIVLTDSSGKLGHIWWQTTVPSANYDTSWATPNNAQIQPNPTITSMGDGRYLVGAVDSTGRAWTELNDQNNSAWQQTIVSNAASYFSLTSY